MATKRHKKTQKVMTSEHRGVRRPLFLFVPLCAFLWPLLSDSASAAEPAVRNVNVRGLQVGGTTAITIEGDDLGKLPLPFMPLPKPPKLLLPFPAKQTLKPGSTPNKAEFEVTLDEKVTPGL